MDRAVDRGGVFRHPLRFKRLRLRDRGRCPAVRAGGGCGGWLTADRAARRALADGFYGAVTDGCRPLLHLLCIPGRTVNRATAGYRGEGKTDARDAHVIADQARIRSPTRGQSARTR